jgi:penicillin-binding protein A
VNRAILKLFVLSCLLFALLVGFTSRWTVFEAEALRDKPENRRELLEEQRIRRGPIRAADGTAIARSVPAGAGTFRRTYPDGPLFAFPIGYSDITLGRFGLEASRNDALVGERDDIANIFDQLAGERRAGDEVITTLDRRAQRVAYEALAGRRGSVVAIEPSSGRVRVMASTPPFDPNRAIRSRSLDGISTFNRATLGQYPPGSTFKVVTAAAAIDSGRFDPGTLVDGRSPKEISGAPLNNFGNQSFGRIPLTEALTQSVNTVWAEVGVRLGGETMQRYMERFGFYERVPIDLPPGERQTSAVFPDRRGLARMTSDRVDVGRVSIGQGGLLVSPLQMAMVASAVANEGRLMRPTLTERVVDREGQTSDDVDAEQLSEVMSPQAARQVGDMMASVVREGTGTAAALSGVSVAGKTGTAEINLRGLNQPWFIGFAPRENPRVAIAVTIERVQGGTGGETAAPVARRVLQELLAAR